MKRYYVYVGFNGHYTREFFIHAKDNDDAMARGKECGRYYIGADADIKIISLDD